MEEQTGHTPISNATRQNWKRLHADTAFKLTTRANKRLSKRKVVADKYADVPIAHHLLEEVKTWDASPEDILYTLCVDCLQKAGIWGKPHVQQAMKPFAGYRLLSVQMPQTTWPKGSDVLGFVYQSLLTEGERNATGQYYTSRQVVKEMLGGLSLKKGEAFLDPCCGSGAFLLGVKTDRPEALYGFDINPVAVMIATTNLLVRYASQAFEPHIYCLDFLSEQPLFDHQPANLPLLFDYIYTNPPWGADKEGHYRTCYQSVKSKEKASLFIVEALRRLNTGGCLHFLLPMSLLKIRTHRDIRHYILQSATIRNITLYEGRFDGVFTDYFSISLSPLPSKEQTYTVSKDGLRFPVMLSAADLRGERIPVKALSATDRSIISKMEACRHDDLTHSRWALGIVTGSNKERVKPTPAPGMEAVYAGRQVETITIKPAEGYLLFAPEHFQQCAREAFYRAPEKLIYRFIAPYPVVAYDNRQRLCLNSANILIPQITGISVKSVAVLLNSSLYRYYYMLHFPDIKVLKGNLQALPFPLLTPEQDARMSALADEALASGCSPSLKTAIDSLVFNLFGIDESEQRAIRENFAL